MREVTYILLLHPDSQDYFSTSYVLNEYELSKNFTILNFTTEYLGEFEYLVIDKADSFNLCSDTFWQNISKRYLDLESVQFFKISEISFDEDREALFIKAEPDKAFDIDKYKRHCKIKKIIES